ncbi:MAG TPA: MFS transporter [Limnochordia bacterium]|nr:MFS transporter [Limnochordia bacterium]
MGAFKRPPLAVEAVPNLRWNLRISLVEGVFAIVAFNLVSPLTVIPSYIKELTDQIPGLSAYENSLVSGVFVLFTALPLLVQMLSAPMAERRPYRKPLVVFWCWFARIPWAVLTLTAAYWALPHPVWALVASLLLVVLIAIGGGGSQPAWSDLISRLIPARQRGPLFAWRLVGSGLLAVPGLFLIPHWLHGNHFPATYVALFGISFLLTTGSSVALQFHREPPGPINSGPRGARAALAEIRATLATDRTFRRLCLAGAPIGLSGVISVPIFTVAAINRLDLHLSQVAALSAELTVWFLVAQTLASYLLGSPWRGRSYKWPFALAFLGVPLAGLVVAFADSVYAFDLALALAGFGSGMANMSTLLYIMELAPPERLATYVAVRNALFGPFALSPILGGWLIDRVGYDFTLALSWATVAAGLIMLGSIHPSLGTRFKSPIETGRSADTFEAGP